jgi:hypothetical protein
MKRIKNDYLMLQVKKERLDKHLADVERLIEGWISQLSATDPFASYTRGDSWGWHSTFVPASEQDADSNQMLRKHLKSRALWKHHFDWRRKLDRVFEMSASVRKEAGQRDPEGRPDKRSTSEKRVHTESYLGTALWQAFCLARGQTQNVDYTRGDDGKGVRFGGYLIETSSGSKTEFATICEEHRSLSRELSRLDEMKAIAKEWALVEELQTKMQALTGKALKSSDYLYHCTFCKRLWRA